MTLGDVKQFVVNAAEARLVVRRKEVLRGQSSRRQRRPRYVATSLSQILREVAQDVDQLQPLAKTHAVARQQLGIQNRLRPEMGGAHLRPKLSHTARDAVGVVIQFLFSLQRDNVIGAGRAKSPQVQFLAADDDVQYIAHAPAIGFVQIEQQKQALLAAFQQRSFRRWSLAGA